MTTHPPSWSKRTLRNWRWWVVLPLAVVVAGFGALAWVAERALLPATDWLHDLLVVGNRWARKDRQQ